MLMIYFKRTGKQRPNFEGNRGTETKLWNREHKKTFFFLIFGEQGTMPIHFRGTGTHPGKAPGKGSLAGQLCTNA